MTQFVVVPEHLQLVATTTSDAGGELNSLKMPDLEGVVEQSAPGAELGTIFSEVVQAIDSVVEALAEDLEKFSQNVIRCKEDFLSQDDQGSHDMAHHITW